jgi:hypothetical protein
MKEGYLDTENDLVILTEIIKDTDLTKEQIRKSLSKQEYVKYPGFESDTVSLDRITLIFKDNKLHKIVKQW